MPSELPEEELARRIEDYVLEEENFGIDPRVFAVLDDPDSSKTAIAGTEKMVDARIALRLRSMAKSAYYGLPSRSRAVDFYDVILALGMQPAKVFIIAMALFSRLDAQHKHLEVESFAIAVFARLIAEAMAMNDAARERAELGGLFLQLGRVIIAMYQSSRDAAIDPGFVERHHRRFALGIIEKFALPEFLAEMAAEDRLVLARRSFGASGAVKLAQCLVQRVLKDYGVLEIKSPMPEVADNLDATTGSRISDYFQMIGLGRFVRIVPAQEAVLPSSR